MPKQYLLISGNPVVGLKYVGPFESEEDANSWAFNEEGVEEFWVIEMKNPAITLIPCTTCGSYELCECNVVDVDFKELTSGVSME